MEKITRLIADIVSGCTGTGCDCVGPKIRRVILASTSRIEKHNNSARRERCSGATLAIERSLHALLLTLKSGGERGEKLCVHAALVLDPGLAINGGITREICIGGEGVERAVEKDGKRGRVRNTIDFIVDGELHEGNETRPVTTALGEKLAKSDGGSADRALDLAVLAGVVGSDSAMLNAMHVDERADDIGHESALTIVL
jgi:hypothetical protein